LFEHVVWIQEGNAESILMEKSLGKWPKDIIGRIEWLLKWACGNGVWWRELDSAVVESDICAVQ